MADEVCSSITKASDWLTTRHSVLFPAEHKVYMYDDGESPGGGAARQKTRPPDTVCLLDEEPRGTDQSAAPRGKGEEPERLKPSRCLSDPGPNMEEEEGGGDSLLS